MLDFAQFCFYLRKLVVIVGVYNHTLPLGALRKIAERAEGSVAKKRNCGILQHCATVQISRTDTGVSLLI